MKLKRLAQSAVPDEPVLAAGIFQAAGSLTARMAGFGEISRYARNREERTSSGLDFKRYILLAVTPTRLFVFDARSSFGWRVKQRLACWYRHSIQTAIEDKTVTTRVVIEVPGEGRRLQLECKRGGSRSMSAEVLRLLREGAVPRPDVIEPPLPAPPRAAARESEEGRRRRVRAGGVALAGGILRLLAYSMPWVMVTSTVNGHSLELTGWRALGEPIISVAYSIVIAVAAVMYLAGRREAGPRLLFTLGVGSLIVMFIQIPTTVNAIASAKTLFQQRGLSVTVALSFGAWVEAVGAIAAFVGGFLARRASKADSAESLTVAGPRSTSAWIST
jgi:hypothetical protein